MKHYDITILIIMLLEDKSYEISPLKITKYVLKHMVVVFWGVSLVPYYMAWVFASEVMFPSASFQPEFYKFILGLIIIGPFLGGSTLLYNDYWDFKMDKISRRKSEFPLPKGLISRRTIFRAAITFMIFAIIFSLFISISFTILIIISIFLAIIYSAPPIRVKNHPGLDVLLNATGSGILCSFAGWIVVKPITEFPVLWLIPMFTGVAALYIPTTIIDYESDKSNGVNTIAVYLGKKGAFYLGLLCIAIANATVMAMGFINYLIGPKFSLIFWPVATMQVILYWIILKKQTFENVFLTIVGLSILLSIGNIMLLLYYTGIWTL
jgi:chlorophyll synthase